MKVEAYFRNFLSFFLLCWGFFCLLGTWSLFLALPLRFLYLYPLRHLLHHCFQALMDHGVKVASILANSFSRRCSYIAESDAHVKEKAIQFGFVLGQQLCCWFVLFIYYCWQKVVVKSLFSCQVAFCQTLVGTGTQRKSSCRVSSCVCCMMRFCTGIVHWSAVWGEGQVFFLLYGRDIDEGNIST